MIYNNPFTFCGSDDLALESFLHGATGWVSVAGNIAPNSASKMLEHVEAGNYNEAKWMDGASCTSIPRPCPTRLLKYSPYPFTASFNSCTMKDGAPCVAMAS